MTERDRSKRYAVVVKLLAKATGVAGTPEADTFIDHALGLIAQYGVEQLEGSAGGVEARIERRAFVVEGDHLRQRIILLHRIASALHCAYVYWQFSPTAATMEVWGATRHVERVQVLYEPLLTWMLEQASTTRWTPSPGVSPDDHCTGWMIGFSRSIHERLGAAETAAAAVADRRAGTDIRTRCLSVDAQRATTERDRMSPRASRAAYMHPLDVESVAQGYRAGRGSNGGR